MYMAEIVNKHVEDRYTKNENITKLLLLRLIMGKVSQILQF